MRPSSQMRRRSPCKREKTRLDSVGRAPHSITPRPVDPALRLRTAINGVRFVNEVPILRRLAEQRLQRSVKPSSMRPPWCESKSADQIRCGSGRMARLRSSKPMTRVRFSRPAPLIHKGVVQQVSKTDDGDATSSVLPALTRGVMAAQRSLKPSGLGSSPSGSTSFKSFRDGRHGKAVHC
jgi:hypothetical protein